MKRVTAIQHLIGHLGDALVINCNGMISREMFTHADSDNQFYMIGSMGLAGSIGLGVAIGRPDRQVVVIDGDGNLLMNAGVMGNIAVEAPANFRHVILDNATYGSTGGQKTISNGLDLTDIARSFGYRKVYRVEDPQNLDLALPDFLSHPGPCLLHVRVKPGNQPGIKRVSHTPTELTARFRAACVKE